MLIRPAEHDLYPFYPDLVIFHVFGANQQYEQIIRSIRSRTTAEVLMQTDRVGAKWPQEQPDEKADKGLVVGLPDESPVPAGHRRKYGCGLCDIRDGLARHTCAPTTTSRANSWSRTAPTSTPKATT